MDTKRAKGKIRNIIEAYLLKDENREYAILSTRQRPALLIDPPGVGKTQIMEQISRECRIELVAYTIAHHTRQSTMGFPFIEKRVFGGREYTVTKYIMSKIVISTHNMTEETGLKEGILSIDEINCISETLAPTMLQFLQCETFGSYRIPKGWVIAAAENPLEYNKSIRELDVMALDRIERIDVGSDLGVWEEYVYKESIHPAIIPYLGTKGQSLRHIGATVDGKLFVIPGGWKDLPELILIYEKPEKRADRNVIGQYIWHPRIIKDLANYLEFYYKYQNQYQVDQILEGIIREDLHDRVAEASLDERLSVTGLLLPRLVDGFEGMFVENWVMKLLMIQLKAFRQELELGEEPEEEPRAKMQVEMRAKSGAEMRMGTRVEAHAEKRPSEVLRHLIGSVEAERAWKRKSGLLGKQEDRINRRCMTVVEGLVKQMWSGTIMKRDET